MPRNTHIHLFVPTYCILALLIMHIFYPVHVHIIGSVVVVIVDTKITKSRKIGNGQSALAMPP